jgi:hypothetical protein
MIVTPADGKHYDAILRLLNVKDLDPLDITVDVAPRENSDRRDRSRRGENSRERGRDRHRPRERRPAPAADAEASHASAPAREPARRPSPRNSRPVSFDLEQTRGARRPQREEAERTVAFGDHVPEFLLR